MFEGLPSAETLGLDGRTVSWVTFAVIFGGALLRAGLGARSGRSSARGHAWAFAGVLVTLASIALLAAVRFAPTPDGLGPVVVLLGLISRAIGLTLIILGFVRAALSGGRAVWLDWVFVVLFSLGMLAFTAVLISALGGLTA